jgi:hypothetical protein
MALPALARVGRPLFTETMVVDESAQVDPLLTDVCGFEISFEATGRVRTSIFEGGRIIDHVSVHSVLTNAATGETLDRLEVATVDTSGVESFDPTTGLLTIEIDDEVRGVPSKWSKPGEGTLLRDAGLLSFEGTVVVDLATGQTVSDDVAETVRGPHPELLETDVIEFICANLA